MDDSNSNQHADDAKSSDDIGDAAEAAVGDQLVDNEGDATATVSATIKGNADESGNETNEIEDGSKKIHRRSSKISDSGTKSAVHGNGADLVDTTQSKATMSNLQEQKQMIINMRSRTGDDSEANSKSIAAETGSTRNDLQSASCETSVPPIQPPRMSRQRVQAERRVAPGAQWMTANGNTQENWEGDYEDSIEIGDINDIDPATAMATNTDRVGAITATAVSPEELEAEYRQTQNFIDATVLPPSISQQQQYKRRKRNMMMSVAACLLMLTVVIAFTVLPDNSQDETGRNGVKESKVESTVSPFPTNAPTPSPTLSSPQIKLAEYLESVSPEMYDHGGNHTALSSILPLYNPNSPQHQALLWLTQSITADTTTNSDEATLEVAVQNNAYYKGSLEDGRLSNMMILQYYAYVSFFYSTNGDSWYDQANWLSTRIHVCNWDGDEFSMPLCLNDGLVLLEIINNNLVGSIPPELGFLSKLQTFSLHSNYLTGTIPPYIFAGCTDLRRVSLNRNHLDGSIPTTIGLASDMESLNLSDNPKMIGTLPSELGNLFKLRNLNLSNNVGMAGGTIPTEIGRLTSLTTLDLSGVQWIGSLPSEIGFLTNLRTLKLEGNLFSGVIPSKIAQLTKLTRLTGV